MTHLSRISILLLAISFLAQPASAADKMARKTMPASIAEEQPDRPPSGASAILRGVDKITARVADLEVALDDPVMFGSLEIVLRYCYKRPPEDTPEVFAFLEIDNHPPEGDPHNVFTGWMFASSPALSALEHPVYDVWVIDCNAAAPETEDGKAAKSP